MLRVASRVRIATAARCAPSITQIRTIMKCTVRTFSTAAAATKPASTTPLIAPEFGTNADKERRFVYIKGVKNDGRSKRFYAKVDVESVPTVRGEEFGVKLDGRFIVTPYNQILSAPNVQAATAIAFEWDAQGDFIRPISMPLTNICVTALDQAYTDRNRFLTHFRNAMQTDSVLSVTGEGNGTFASVIRMLTIAMRLLPSFPFSLRVDSPSGLFAQQKKQWDPLLKWFSDRYGCNLTTTLEIETPTQDAEAVKIQQQLLQSLTGWQLAALDSLTTVTKSFVISWSLLTHRISIDQAFEASRLEENFQMRKYGQVEGVYGHGIEMEFTRMSLSAAKTWINLVATDPKDNPLLLPNKPQ